jgi:surfeit locus 1 family protein
VVYACKTESGDQVLTTQIPASLKAEQGTGRITTVNEKCELMKREINVGPVLVRVNWLVVACIAIVSGTCFRLGLWQLDRAAEKVALIEAVQIEQKRDAVAIESIPAHQLEERHTRLSNLHVSLVGEYVDKKNIFIIPRFFGGEPGVGVVTPFRLQSNNQLVLVDRGWAGGALPSSSQTDLKTSGQQRLTAQIHLSDVPTMTSSVQLDDSDWPQRVRHLNVDALSSALNEQLFPYPVRLTADQPGVLIRSWPAVTVNVKTNIFYALQWFSFAIIILVASLLASSNIYSLLRKSKP